MKREIKFRGKDKRTGEWFYGNLFVRDTRDRTHVGTPLKMCLDVDPDTVGQFVGLADRNGKEIYEGDIISAPNREDVAQEIIIFKDGCFQVRGGWYTQVLSRINTLERIVIGNIHDNPELLKHITINL